MPQNGTVASQSSSVVLACDADCCRDFRGTLRDDPRTLRNAEGIPVGLFCEAVESVEQAAGLGV
jgi:hypothetical protein